MPFSVLDSSGRLKTVAAQSQRQTVPVVLSSNLIIPANTGIIIPESLEISAGVQLEIGAGAKLEVLRDRTSNYSLLELSTDRANSGPTVALSTLGVRDWVGMNGITTNPPISSLLFHFKASGGWIARSFLWVLGDGTSPTLFSQASALTYTSTSPDDYAAAALNTSNGTGIFITAGGKYGFTFNVPALLTKQTLVMYASCYNCVAQLNLKLSGSGKSITYNKQNFTANTLSSGITSDDLYRINFADAAGGQLSVSYLCQTLSGSSDGPNIKLMFAYLF